MKRVNIKMSKLNKKIKAITIVETLITLLAISIMLIGPLTFVSKSFKYAKYSQEKIIATGLSQEGVELFSSLRSGVSSSTLISTVSSCVNNTCAIDWNGLGGSETDINLYNCNGESCRLYINTDGLNKTYKHNITSDKSSFLRQLIIVKYNDAYVVKSRVWSEDASGIPLDITLQKTVFIF